MTCVLILETTCDETAAAVVNDELQVLGAVTATQDELHGRYRGVVPEIASRAHVERILPTIERCLALARLGVHELDAVAVAHTPGLAGSLLVGLSAAKALALALGVPLVGVNHLQAHIYACRMAAGEDVFPCVGLVVSGGHTNLFRCRTALEFEPLGGTIDDAAGEAFDKVASLLGLGYPGGPAIERAAQAGNPRAFDFPRTFLRDKRRLEFSFSGLKTAVRYKLAAPETPLPDPATLPSQLVADLAASFQAAVVDVLVRKCEQAFAHTGLTTLCVGGGVAANAAFRRGLAESSGRRRYTLHVAPPKLCTDNAVMGAIAFEHLRAGQTASLDLDAYPGLVRGRTSNVVPAASLDSSSES